MQGITAAKDLLAGLNDQQREAVLEQSAPLLVLAGAGSGKTRVITTKIAWCIKESGIRPWEILAVTFTNKAAGEMLERVQIMLPEIDASDLVIKTFHSFGAMVLRRFGERIGLKNGFTIYDDEDSLSVLAACYPEFKKKELQPVMRAISRMKDMGLGPNDDLSHHRVDDHFVEQFAAYENKLRTIGNVDFADLITRTIELVDREEEVQSWLHRRFKVVLVDEYQDSNIAQFELLRRIVGPKTFICVVGDDDQSIYRFRGAEVKHILSFPEVYEGTRIIKLEQNYRSTQSILAVANEVIGNNLGRHEKRLWTANEIGTKPQLIYVDDERNEAEKVASIINRDRRFDQTAVLYRTNAQSVNFETLFTRLNIPYKLVGALKFYDREEVKDALALIYLVMNPADIVNFRRMINKPARGIGEASQDRIIAYGETLPDGDLMEALRKSIQEGLITGKAAIGAKEFLATWDAATQRLKEGNNAEFAEYLIRESGLLEYHKKNDDLNKTSRVGNLERVVTAISEYPSGREGVTAYLESLTLDPTSLGYENPTTKPGVSLITMHNTKGLEFDRVFVTGMEEGIFPGRSCDNDDDLEEERRIFYVSVTRARKELYLLSCKRRMIWGRTNYELPSRFLSEIPSNLILTEGRPSFGDNDSSWQGYGALGDKRQRAAKGIPSNIISSPVSKRLSTPADVSVPREERTGSYNLGDRVWHESYGTGEVVQIRNGAGGKEIVDVSFETGKKATFITAFAPLEKIGSD